MASGIVLHDLIITSIFDNFCLERGLKRRLTPAELAEAMVPWWVIIEKLVERDALGHPLLLPTLQAVITELALEERDSRGASVSVP